MSDVAIGVATVVPALSLAAGGVALVGTRSRPAGVLMVVAAIGVIGSALVRLGGDDSVAQVLLVGSLMLPTSAAVLAYPRLSFRYAVDFCIWIIVAGAGVIGTFLALDLEIASTLASVTGLALIAHGWWSSRPAPTRTAKRCCGSRSRPWPSAWSSASSSSSSARLVGWPARSC